MTATEIGVKTLISIARDHNVQPEVRLQAALALVARSPIDNSPSLGGYDEHGDGR